MLALQRADGSGQGEGDSDAGRAPACLLMVSSVSISVAMLFLETAESMILLQQMVESIVFFVVASVSQAESFFFRRAPAVTICMIRERKVGGVSHSDEEQHRSPNEADSRLEPSPWPHRLW